MPPLNTKKAMNMLSKYFLAHQLAQNKKVNLPEHMQQNGVHHINQALT
jgi:hypothetical protein